MFKTEIRALKDGFIIIVPIDEVEEFYNMIENLPTRYPRELKEKLEAYF